MAGQVRGPWEGSKGESRQDVVTNPNYYRWITAASRPSTEPDTHDDKNYRLYSTVCVLDTLLDALPILVTPLIPPIVL